MQPLAPRLMARFQAKGFHDESNKFKLKQREATLRRLHLYGPVGDTHARMRVSHPAHMHQQLPGGGWKKPPPPH